MNQIESSKSEKLKKFLLKNAFPLFGLGALIWFLIRVIPKPSRAAYPCMKVAAPMASSFVLWLIGLSATIFSFGKMKSAFGRSSFGYMALFLIIGIGSLIFTLNQSSTVSYGARAVGFEETVTPNYPIGVARGIKPGAVVWIWNPDATNEDCTNSYFGSDGTPANANDDGWFLSKNNNQEAIDEMLSEGLKQITGDTTDIESWESIFKYFNNRKHSADQGYQDGEKIFIKINATSTWGKGQPWGNITANFEHMRNSYYGTAETSPHLILSLVRQLVNVYGVSEENISIGDPMKHIYQNSYTIWHSEFPNIHYVGYEGGLGREAVIPTDSEVMIYSDKGADMPSAISDKIYTVMNNADYLINVPTMKAHARGGITLFAKNHFGSHTRPGADHLHTGLVAPDNAQPVRIDSSMYRVQVDNMGHEKYGENQVLFLLDALWSGSEATDPPTKWDMAPFNHDWTSSIFLSQDNVAIESVAFDFLYSEYDGSLDPNYIQKVNYPHMDGTTDYLRQAASSDYWPEGVIYDPENDGTPITSLGVNEHWNNPIDKQYTRNLGTGDGVELIFVNQTPIKILLNQSLGVIGDTIEVELSAFNLSNIGLMNLYIQYNLDAIQYLGIGDVNLPSFADGTSDTTVNLEMTDVVGFNHGGGLMTTLLFELTSDVSQLVFAANSDVRTTNDEIVNVKYTNGSIDVLRPPFFTSAMPEDTTIIVTATPVYLNYKYRANDPQGESVIFSLIDAPDNAAISPSGDFSFIPTLGSDMGYYEYTIIVKADNGVLASYDTTKTIFDVTVGVEENNSMPNEYSLWQNYPNPFNPTTTINFSLKESASVKLEIYDLTGSLVTTLISNQKPAGWHSVVWNGRNSKGQKVSSGNYIYTIRINDGKTNFIESKKMLLLK